GEAAPQWRVPLGLIPRTGISRRQLKKPVSPFIVAPRAQASRRCGTQALLSGKAAKLCYRFGPLTPSARSANLIACDGTKNGLSRSEQKTVSKNPKQHVNRKSRIQVLRTIGSAVGRVFAVRRCSQLRHGPRRRVLSPLESTSIRQSKAGQPSTSLGRRAHVD